MATATDRAAARALLLERRSALLGPHADLTAQIAHIDADLATLAALDEAERRRLDTPLHRGEVNAAGIPTPRAAVPVTEPGRVPPPERTRWRHDEAGNAVYVPGIDTPVNEAGIPV